MGDVINIRPGEPIPENLGGEVFFESGIHFGPLELTRSVILRGAEGAILRGAGTGSVVEVTAKKATIRLENLTLSGGRTILGGGLRLAAYSDVTLVDCVVEGSHASRGGSGLAVSRGQLQMIGGRVGPEQDILVKTVARATLEEVQVAGTLWVLDGAQAVVSRGFLARLRAAGTTTRRPTVKLVGVEPAIENHPVLGAQIERLG